MAKLKKRRPAARRQGRPARKAPELFAAAYKAHQAGALQEAEEGYKAVLRQRPDHADALNLLGVIRLQAGRIDSAVRLTQKAVKQQPDNCDYLANLGSALRAAGNFKAATQAFGRALAIAPHHPPALFNLALLWEEERQYGKAEERLTTLVALHPGMTKGLERLARVLELQEKYDEALERLRQLADKLDNPAPAYNNTGNILVKQGKLHEALAWYQKAAEADPDLTEASVNLAWLYKEHGMLEEDIACLRACLARRPDPQTHSDLLFSMNYSASYTPDQLHDEAGEWWRRHGPVPPPPPIPGGPLPKTLRLGFLSPDLRRHPVGQFIKPLLRHLDPQRIKVTCYAETPRDGEDAVSAEIKGLCAAWRCTVGRDTNEIIDVIRQDGIHVLIDLAGHSAGNRLDVMAMRAAPVQANWLGYVNTTGLATIDYRITDWVTDPEGAERLNHETLVRMPHAFFCYEPPPEADGLEPGPLPAREAGRLTFASFNNIAKITDQVITLWGEIMNGVPESRLLLVAKQFCDPVIRDRMLERFARNGVAPQRITPMAGLSMREYLALHNEVDIALDPFPHNGHTITCHALWMGVPCVVLRGDRYAARMGASVLTAAGLDELIAEDKRQYVAKTITLARDLDGLAELRRSLRRRMRQAPICDARGFARDFTGLIWDMARGHFDKG